MCRLLQLALQDLAPDAPCRWDKNEAEQAAEQAEQAAEPAAGPIQGQTERGKEGPRQEVASHLHKLQVNYPPFMCWLNNGSK